MKDIKQEIIDTGLYLLEKGLIARTWGNVSARLNDDEFLITPTGKAYTDITLADLATVKIKDCSYDEKGPKPSSEKLVHAAIYQNRPEVNYVVHTHQFYASAICAEGYSIYLNDGSFLPCARYATPGTKALQKNVAKEVIDNPDCDAFLMEKHGAVVCGKTMKEVLKKIEQLEKLCKWQFNHRVKEFYIPEKMDAWIDDYAQMVPAAKDDDQEALELVIRKNAAAQLYSRDGKPLSSLERNLQHLVYQKKYSKLKDQK